MKVSRSFAAFIFACLLVSCGPTIYKASDFEASKSSVKNIAILPFQVSIDTEKMPQGVSVEALKESEQKTGYEVQSHAYSWFLQREKNYTVKFQDVDKTNALLRKNNINYEDLVLQDKADLCKLLGVDAVISGKASLSKPMSEGAAVALRLLLGSWSTTHRATTTLTIHNTAGELLWKYDWDEGGSFGSSSQSLTDDLLKNASKNFPYQVSNTR